LLRLLLTKHLEECGHLLELLRVELDLLGSELLRLLRIAVGGRKDWGLTIEGHWNGLRDWERNTSNVLSGSLFSTVVLVRNVSILFTVVLVLRNGPCSLSLGWSVLTRLIVLFGLAFGGCCPRLTGTRRLSVSLTSSVLLRMFLSRTVVVPVPSAIVTRAIVGSLASAVVITTRTVISLFTTTLSSLTTIITSTRTISFIASTSFLTTRSPTVVYSIRTAPITTFPVSFLTALLMLLLLGNGVVAKLLASLNPLLHVLLHLVHVVHQLRLVLEEHLLCDEPLLLVAVMPNNRVEILELAH